VSTKTASHVLTRETVPDNSDDMFGPTDYESVSIGHSEMQAANRKSHCAVMSSILTESPSVIANTCGPEDVDTVLAEMCTKTASQVLTRETVPDSSDDMIGPSDCESVSKGNSEMQAANRKSHCACLAY